MLVDDFQTVVYSDVITMTVWTGQVEVITQSFFIFFFETF